MKTLQEKLVQTRRNEELAIDNALKVITFDTSTLTDIEERLTTLTAIAVRLKIQEEIDLDMPIEQDILRLILPFFLVGVTTIDRRIIEDAIEQTD